MQGGHGQGVLGRPMKAEMREPISVAAVDAAPGSTRSRSRPRDDSTGRDAAWTQDAGAGRRQGVA